MANGMRLDARLAAYAYEQEEHNKANAEAASVPEVHWRDASTGFVRQKEGVHTHHRNKQASKLQWKKFEQRASHLTPLVAKAVAAAAREKKKDGTNHAGRAEQRQAGIVVAADARQAKRHGSS